MINWILAGSIVGICVLLTLYATLPRLIWSWKHCWFAKEETEPKPLKAYLDWVDWRGTLEQRVTALEQRVQSHQSELMILAHRSLTVEEQVWNLLEAATPSPATASPTRDCPSDAAEQESIPPESLASSRSDQRIIVGGRVGRALKSAQETDVPT